MRRPAHQPWLMGTVASRPSPWPSAPEHAGSVEGNAGRELRQLAHQGISGSYVRGAGPHAGHKVLHQVAV